MEQLRPKEEREKEEIEYLPCAIIVLHFNVVIIARHFSQHVHHDSCRTL